MAKLLSRPVSGPWVNPDWSAPDFFETQDKAFKALYDSAPTDPDGPLLGALLSFPVADGKAWYRVQNEKPLTLAHIPIFDAWSVHPAMIRGLTVADVRDQLRRNQALNKLFGNSSK